MKNSDNVENLIIGLDDFRRKELEKAFKKAFWGNIKSIT